MNRRDALVAVISSVIGLMSHATEKKSNTIKWMTIERDPCDFSTRKISWDMTCFEDITLTCGDTKVVVTREEILDALTKREVPNE